MRPWLPAVLAGLLLAGCSGSPFGEQLSRSFSGTPTAGGGAAPAGSAAGTSPAGANAAGGGPVSGTAAPAASGTARERPVAPGPAAEAPAAAAPAAPKPAQPQPPVPYRVTLQLPAADPSAPAEALTQALRAAGVPFAVESIERVGTGGGAPTPAAEPAAPVVPRAATPAPAPR